MELRAFRSLLAPSLSLLLLIFIYQAGPQLTERLEELVRPTVNGQRKDLLFLWDSLRVGSLVLPASPGGFRPGLPLSPLTAIPSQVTFESDPYPDFGLSITANIAWRIHALPFGPIWSSESLDTFKSAHHLLVNFTSLLDSTCKEMSFI